MLLLMTCVVLVRGLLRMEYNSRRGICLLYGFVILVVVGRCLDYSTVHRESTNASCYQSCPRHINIAPILAR